jgi:nitroimidazol reductase NimA-like FMN-containing flavoprotein (pyridoxamine 5'-phosphate oxidase superfamily)
MASVKTELDDRFSDPDAAATSWEEAERALAAAQLFWITTVRRDGRPHVTPLVAIWNDGALHFCTGPEEQKAVNLTANRQVALTTGCNDWERGLDIVVEGEAERITDVARLTELAAAWTGKWDGQWKFRPVAEGFAHEAGEGIGYVFAVRPTKVLVFGKSPFSHTRHVFSTGPELH